MNRNKLTELLEGYYPDASFLADKILALHNVSCCDFALWLQDNYSTNKKQGEIEPLPKGYWRKDFTNEHYSITELIAIYNRSCS